MDKQEYYKPDETRVASDLANYRRSEEIYRKIKEESNKGKYRVELQHENFPELDDSMIRFLKNIGYHITDVAKLNEEDVIYCTVEW